MSELRQQMIDAVLVRGFSPRTHKGRRNIKTSELIATVPTRGRTFYIAAADVFTLN